jgi:hypothetical protein
MKKNKTVVTKTASELAEALGLYPADGVEIELRSDLNNKIISVVESKGLTHAQVAKLAQTSRTREELMNEKKLTSESKACLLVHWLL